MQPSYQQLALMTLLLTHQAVSAEAAHQPNPELQDQPANSWQTLSHGDVTAPGGLLAYSGAWYDNKAHALCLFGGGHWNYSGNEVWCLDIGELKWRQLYEPDVVTGQGEDQKAYQNYKKEYPGALFKPADEPVAEARPMSRHTYDQMEFIPGLGALVWGGYSWGDGGQGWCQSCPDTWVFDRASNRWRYLYNGDNPSPNGRPGDAGVGSSAWAGKDDLLYVVSRGKTWTFDPETHDWSQLEVDGQAPWSIEGTLEYDSKRHQLYFFGGNYPENGNLFRFDIRLGRWDKPEPSGDGPGLEAKNGPGLAYAPDHDVLLVCQGGRLWAYHPADNRWQALKPEDPPRDKSGYVFGRFRYDPVNKGFWLHGWRDEAHTTWFYRYQ